MIRVGLAAIAAVLLLGVAPNSARGDALSDARTAFEASDYANARPALDKALATGTNGPAELAEIYKMIGFVEGALGNPQQATDAFAKWLSLDPKGALPSGTSPKIMKPYNAANDQIKKRGSIEAKTETEDAPPSVTLIVVTDPHKLITGAKVHFRADKRTEQALEASLESGGRVKIELEAGKRIDLRIAGIDKHGNRVVELGSRAVPIVIIGGEVKPVIDPVDTKLVKQPRTVSPSSPRPWFKQWWVWGIGTGVATGVTGFFAWRTYSHVQELDSLNANSYTHPYSDAQDAERRAHRDVLIMDISAGVAGALAIGTAILYLTRPSASTETQAAVTPMPGGGALVVGGQF